MIKIFIIFLVIGLTLGVLGFAFMPPGFTTTAVRILAIVFTMLAVIRFIIADASHGDVRNQRD
jgi:uncharacterized membrane protein YtjA (UPF0391 family)